MTPCRCPLVTLRLHSYLAALPTLVIVFLCLWIHIPQPWAVCAAGHHADQRAPIWCLDLPWLIRCITMCSCSSLGNSDTFGWAPGSYRGNCRICLFVGWLLSWISSNLVLHGYHVKDLKCIASCIISMWFMNEVTLRGKCQEAAG